MYPNTRHMNQQQRDAFFERSIRPFLSDPDDALWVLETVRERVKADFPDLPLTQRHDADDVITRVSNEKGKVEGNAWKRMKVIPSV